MIGIEKQVILICLKRVLMHVILTGALRYPVSCGVILSINQFNLLLYFAGINFFLFFFYVSFCFF